MFPVPVSFCFDFGSCGDAMRRYAMHEFAVNGAKHLVFTDFLFRKCLGDANLAAALLKEMAAEGLTFVDSHAPCQGKYDPIYPDPACRRQMILRMKLCLNICAEVGVDTFTVHIGNDFPYPDIPLETHLGNIRGALDEILPEAERCGVTVCMENIWVRSNVSPVLIALKKEYPTDFLGLCYDSGHANLMEKGKAYKDNAVTGLWPEAVWQEHILEDMLPDVVNCHLHDNSGQYDEHLLPGRGNIDWPHIMGLLKRAPRLKNIQSEVSAVGGLNSIRDLVRTFDGLMTA